MATDSIVHKMRRWHRENHPDCTYGDQPHYVPPSAGQIGFYLCDVPVDLTNHTRCSPPFDHEHPDHAVYIEGRGRVDV
jgi:hypothetical protein